jgi:hypothetical protein
VIPAAVLEVVFGDVEVDTIHRKFDRNWRTVTATAKGRAWRYGNTRRQPVDPMTCR